MSANTANATLNNSNNCALKINGQKYEGWKDVHIERGIEQMTGIFRLEVSERWPAQVTPRPIMASDACVLSIDDEPVITGWVDETSPGFNESGTSFDVTGRDKSGDLCDCSAIFKTGQWKKTTLKQIATDLLAPYAIPLTITASATKAAMATIASFNIEDGETVLACLDRACKIKALMIWADGAGGLVLGLPGLERATTALEQGVNIISCKLTYKTNDRHSEYIVKGQARGKGGHNIKDSVKDPAVTRHRPLIIINEEQGEGHTPKERANFELATRQSRGNRATVRVQSWRQDGDKGALWAPGLLVSFASDYVRFHGYLLIVKVAYIKNERDGTVCDLELADPHALDRLSEDKNKPKAHKATRKGKASHKDMSTL
ncbi:hypothetical protein DTO96_102531 [Ephemeroptericola cinctiostellae]|uniref:Phage tail protein n=1 Tax=Ephemeroptericola cinctiostellae TaxID=2268024 RepID=A0A345DEI7_9BURK|nr:hypothetical protein [Ephemeroptericola cinctiostellae]AXF86775.1 hypothetical protein DTO96_102531 [Ephemeroptericola cinctiostellae]